MIEDKGDNYLSMSVVKNPEASNLIYTAEVSSDLIHWSPATEIVMDTTHSKFNDALPISQAPKMFIRLKAESHL